MGTRAVDPRIQRRSEKDGVRVVYNNSVTIFETTILSHKY